MRPTVLGTQGFARTKHQTSQFRDTSSNSSVADAGLGQPSATVIFAGHKIAQ
jgi:hypothetical protein